MLGLARASGGSATVFGLDPWNDAVALHKRIAYVPGDVSLWPNLSGGKTVESGTLAELRHLTRTEVSFARNGLTDADIARIPAIHDIALVNGRARFTVDSDKISSVLPVLRTSTSKA
ncbi:hypothetical protein HNP00_000327 [Arthrobacter sp. AZCC_0090]|nr:hypothetical protein [Arthrobacter sp. AZCC_0090]